MTLAAVLGDTLSVSLYYNAEQFEEGAVARMGRCFELFLKQIVMQPEARLQTLIKEVVDKEGQQYMAWLEQSRKSNLQSLKSIKRKAKK